MIPIGYLLYKDGVISASGQYYNYIIAGNGVYISASNSLISVEIPIANCTIRGLIPSAVSRVNLEHGKIPARIFDLAISVLLADCTKEKYVAIVWSDSYRIVVPGQDGLKAEVKYETVESTVLELHSHPDMSAVFSSQDNRDEQGLKLYGVVGNLVDEQPTINLRIGVYGYFQNVLWRDVFEGSLQGCYDHNEENEIVQDRHERHDGREDRSRWLRWDRWFRK